MNVSFDPAVLQEERHGKFLDAILHLFEKGRHTWVVDDAQVVRSSNWFQLKGKWEKNRVSPLLDTAKPRGVYMTNNFEVEVSASEEFGEPLRLLPSDALELLSSPVRILVEDSDSDGAFVSAILFRFGEKRMIRRFGKDDFLKIKNSWVEGEGDGEFFRIRHGGGATLSRSLTSGCSKRISPPMVAIVDSDLESPEEPYQPRSGSTWDKAQAAVESLRDKTYPPKLHPLARRSIENYLPMAALGSEFSRKKGGTLNAYSRLSEAQRHFYNLKTGLPFEACSTGSGREWSSELQRRLFEESTDFGDQLTAPDLESLRNGFGRDVSECWKQGNETLNARSLKNEAGPDFDRILSAILEAC